MQESPSRPGRWRTPATARRMRWRRRSRLGRDVIGDSVNDSMLTRNAWRDVSLGTRDQVIGSRSCAADLDEHDHRIEPRIADPGLILPDWNAVIGRDYHPWDRDHVKVDTAGRSIAACVELVLAAL